MSIFPRPLKKVLGKIIPFSLVDLIPTFNLGTGVASTATFLRGDQTWSTVPAISGGGGNNVNYYLNGGTAASIGTYYQMSNTPVIGTGVDFSLSGNGLITQWLTDAGNPNTTEIPAGNWNFEMFMSASSSGGVPKFYMEILKYDGSTFTTIANNSAVPEGITGGTSIDLYLSSVAVPFTSLLITDRLAVRVYIVDNTPGRTITQHTQDSHLCQIITSFSSGISSINTLTKNTQYIVAGTSGSDFNVSSSVDTHTLNLPTASALKRGAVSSVDWSTFNAKQNPITLTTTGTGAATFVSDVLNIPTPSAGSGLTVGTTPIALGTIGRILFQGTGNVLQEDANITFNNTQKRLTLKAVGTASTDIPFAIRDSADTANIVETRGNASIVFANGVSTYSLNPRTDADGFSLNSGNGLYGTGTGMEVVSSQFLINNASTRTFRFTGSSVTNLWEFRNESGQLRICPTTDTTNPIINLNGTTRFVGVGILTPAARLDVKAQGALSTDIAFRVRNSADTVNLVDSSGNGSFFLRANTGDMHFMFDAFNSRIHLKRTGVYTITTDNAVTALDINCNNGNLSLRGGSSMLNIVSAGNFHFEETSGTLATSGAGAIVMKNRTAPSTNVQDRFYLYSADIVAGNAAPHFRTENGGIIKLYKETTAVTASTLVSNLGVPLTDTDTFDGYTLKQIVKALRNQGLLT